MKPIAILSAVMMFLASFGARAQDITLNKRDISLSRLFDEIKKQTGYDFLYNPKIVARAKPVNVTAVKTPLRTVLDNCFANQPLSYTIDQRTIIVKEKIGDAPGTLPVITGIVMNKDGKPVENASVFLNNATIGDKTDAAGKFRLDNVRPGNYELVVSIIGYETSQQSINTGNASLDLPAITLLPKTIDLREVVIKTRKDAGREGNYRLFLETFLGNTELADECKILNPEVLDFDYNDSTRTLKASANDFLIIENNSLGYRIRYLLSDFTNDRTGIGYNGSVLFEPMRGTASQQRKWEKKREQVYATSEMHFLRSLLDGQLDEEGFRVLQYITMANAQRPPDSLINVKIAQYKNIRSSHDSLAYWTRKEALPKVFKTLSHVPLDRQQLLNTTDLDGIYAFGSKHNDLYIEYSKNHHFHENDKLLNLISRYNHEEATVLNFASPYLFFDENGWVKNPKDVTMRGIWEQYRVAGMLPSDYEPLQSQVNESRVIVPDTSDLGKQLVKLKGVSDSLNGKYAAEKIFIQFDRPYYAAGDTIWLKGYLLNAPTYFLSAKSRFLHVDIATDSDKVIKQYLFPVQEGLTWGKIGLDENDFKPGNYVIRAYTQWMQNFGNDAYYYKNIQVTGANEGSWLVNTSINSSATGDRQTISAKLQFTTTAKVAVADQTLQLQVKTGSKTWYKQSVRTDHDGLLNVKFSLPENLTSASLVAENAAKEKKAAIPLVLDVANPIDLQFFPEGGELVAGFNTRIGFKAIGANGKAVNVSGIITDQNQKQVAIFQSAHQGMGSFDLVAEPGAQYSAQVSLPNGAKGTYALPAVKTSGTFLQVKSISDDSLEVNVAVTTDLVGQDYFLVGKARGVICYAAVVGFGKANFIHRKVAKGLFPTGIAHFILMTPQARPMNERLVYIDHHDNLHIVIRPDQSAYTTKDSVALHIKVTDNDDRPLAGNFSLAVTDDAQVKTDSLNDDNILTHMLLTSDLKGYVEGPGYYFQDNKAAKQALDNLLLTQGWVGYEPTDPEMPYEAETEYKVSGRVNNVFGGAVKKTHVLLFSKSPAILIDTTTDNNGRFMFNKFPRVDTALFILKAVNRSGKSVNVNIDMDESAAPVFNAPKARLLMPWYVNTDSTLMNFVKSSTQMKQQDYYPGGGRVLKEVMITAKKTVKGSQNLNGPGNADIVIDEKELEAAGKKTWLQLLQGRVKGFREGIFCVCPEGPILFKFVTDQEDLHVFDQTWYFIHDQPVKFIIDGVPLYVVLPLASYDVPFVNITNYLKSHNAEDIRGIEVNSTTKYAYRYVPMKWLPVIKPSDVAFVEITTRSGSGPGVKNTPGIYLYKPLAISWPKQFYKPKYKVTDTAKIIDLRSTIDWEPNVSTDQNGEAIVWFHAGSQPSTYSIIMQGMDGNGLLGYKRKKIVISAKETGKSK